MKDITKINLGEAPHLTTPRIYNLVSAVRIYNLVRLRTSLPKDFLSAE